MGLLKIITLVSFGASLAFNYKKPIKCVSLNNQPCQARPAIIDINFNETLFYPLIVSIDKCGGSCNTIDDPYAWVCVPNKAKDMNAKIFNVGAKWNKSFSSASSLWV